MGFVQLMRLGVMVGAPRPLAWLGGQGGGCGVAVPMSKWCVPGTETLQQRCDLGLGSLS